MPCPAWRAGFAPSAAPCRRCGKCRANGGRAAAHRSASPGNPHVRAPSAGGCGCGGIRPAQAAAPQLAFPIGRLYYDFGAEARLDYFVQALADWRDGLGGRAAR